MANFKNICFHVAAHLSIISLIYAIPSVLQYVVHPLGYFAFYSLSVYWLMSWGKKYAFTRRINVSSRAVLITGCDCGFGHSLAKFLDTKGFTVFASCLFPEGEGANELKKICSNRLQIVPLDVTKDDSVDKALDYVKKNLKDKALWAIVNNAGILDGVDHALTGIGVYRNLFEVNTFGVVRVTKAFLPLLKKIKGRVVTVTSLGGKFALPHIGPYCMSKFASAAFCDSLRQELYPLGIKAITVEPEAYGTRLASMSHLKPMFQNCWDTASPDIKAMYENDNIDRAITLATTITDTIKAPKISQVIDCLYDAVSLEEPYEVYKPRKNVYTRTVAFLLEVLPTAVSYFGIRLLKNISGIPIPEPRQ